jgi:outer membrane lipoprotein SlyB
MFAGALIGGIIGDKIGRKKAIILYEVIHIVSMIAGALSGYDVPDCLPFGDGIWSGRAAGDAVCRLHRIHAGA